MAPERPQSCPKDVWDGVMVSFAWAAEKWVRTYQELGKEGAADEVGSQEFWRVTELWLLSLTYQDRMERSQRGIINS